MIKAIFQWIDNHPDSYWLAALASIAAVLATTLFSRRDPAQKTPFLRRDAAYLGLILLALLAWRWPHLLYADEFNPDESQFIAGAITLDQYPVFWHSVDGTTSGPVNFYVQLPAHWLGLPLDYFTARLTALFLVWVALAGCYGTLKKLYGEVDARLGVLGPLVFFLLVHEWDYIHFSSEHAPMALMALSICLLVRGSLAARFAGAFLAGLMPWAKLQAGPLAAAIVVWQLWVILKPSRQPLAQRGRATLPVWAGALLPTLIALIVIVFTGQFDSFFRNYVLHNLFYATNDFPLGAAIGSFWVSATETYLLPLFIFAQVTWIVASVAVKATTPVIPQRRDALWWGGAIFTVVGLVSVLLPRRGFLHYTLFLIVPLTLWGGAALSHLLNIARREPRGRWLLAVVLTVACALPLALRWKQPAPSVLGHLSTHWRQPVSPISSVLRAAAQPGDRIAVWGWLARLHVETGLPQGTRVAYSYWSLVPSPLIDYHRATYIADLEETRPAFFVDAVGPGSYYFTDRAKHGHEVVDELGKLIEAHYTLAVDFGSVRLYVRNDLTSRPGLDFASLQRAYLRGRAELAHLVEMPVPLSHRGLTEKTIDGRLVWMLLPPARTSWTLDGSEDEFLFDYGYDPVAYRDATQGDGAAVVVTLEEPGQPPRVLFDHYLDPAHVPVDRGTHTARVALPPFGPGARITIATNAGLVGDDRWDWVFLTRARFHLGPYYSLRPPARRLTP